MIKFLCPKDGISGCSSTLVEIQIPEECCGVKTKLQPTKHIVHGANIFYDKCYNHLRTYKMIWDNFGHNNKMNGFTIGQDHPIINGCTCVSCGMHNQYAEPNLDDNKYKCFECR